MATCPVGDIYKDTDEKKLQEEIDAFSSYIKKSFDEGTCADNKDTKKAEIESLKGKIEAIVMLPRPCSGGL